MRTVGQRGSQWFRPSGLAQRGTEGRTMAALCDSSAFAVSDSASN